MIFNDLLDNYLEIENKIKDLQEDLKKSSLECKFYNEKKKAAEDKINILKCGGLFEICKWIFENGSKIPFPDDKKVDDEKVSKEVSRYQSEIKEAEEFLKNHASSCTSIKTKLAKLEEEKSYALVDCMIDDNELGRDEPDTIGYDFQVFKVTINIFDKGGGRSPRQETFLYRPPKDKQSGWKTVNAAGVETSAMTNPLYRYIIQTFLVSQVDDSKLN